MGEMLRGSRLCPMVAAALAVVALLALLFGCPMPAHADDMQTLEADGFSYTVSGDEATIVGVTSPVSGSLVIPDTLGGAEVTGFAERAFLGAGMTSVSIPASIKAIPTACFRDCANLVTVTFKGSSIGGLGSQAFYRCAALTRIDIPELTKDIPDGFYRIGRDCFSGCARLKTVVFKGNGNTRSSAYFSNEVSNYSVFTGCASLENIVFECKACSIPSMGRGDSTLTQANFYYTLTYYASEQDSAACTNPLYSITCRGRSSDDEDEGGVPVRDILEGKVADKDIWAQSGSLPEAPAGKVWGVQDHAFVSASTVLTDSHHVVPVSQNNLDYGWVASPVTDSYIDDSDSWNTNFPMFYRSSDGSIEKLDSFAAFGADGKALDSGDYKLVFEQAVVTKNPNGSRSTDDWKVVAAVDGAGVYRVHAEGAVQSNQGTKTKTVSFEVEPFTPKVSRLTGSGASCWAAASQAISTAAKSKGAVNSGVVVPASDWRYQLIGAALAGVANGSLIVDNGDDYSSAAVTAFAESGAKSIQIIGSTAAVPQSAAGAAPRYLVDYLFARSGVTNKTRYSKDSSVQELSDQVYSTMKRLHDSGNAIYGSGWGDAAIVASPSANMDVLAIAQYAYANKAPVFFTQGNGTLGQADLGYLASGGFTTIAIAGDASYVSKACAFSIKQATGITPTRLLAKGNDSLDAVMGDLGTLAHGTDTIVIASTAHDANVTAASALAAAADGVLLTVSCSADSKRIQDYLLGLIAQGGQAAIKSVYLVGDFSVTDSTLASRIDALWTSPQSSAIGVGDTVEVGDFTYKLAGARTARLVMLRNHAATSVAVGKVAYGGASYEVKDMDANAFAGATVLAKANLGPITSIPASAFAGCSSLKSVTGASVTAIGQSAFAGCPQLTSVSLPKVAKVGSSAFSKCAKLGSASLPKATSIGASAFEGCAKLKSASLPKAASIGASAFSGCAKLASVSATATGLKSIGKRAFSGCSGLKTLKMNAKKLVKSKVGSNAFSGMPKSAKVYVPKAKVKAYKALFTSKGLPKQATVTAIK